MIIVLHLQDGARCLRSQIFWSFLRPLGGILFNRARLKAGVRVMRFAAPKSTFHAIDDIDLCPRVNCGTFSRDRLPKLDFTNPQLWVCVRVSTLLLGDRHSGPVLATWDTRERDISCVSSEKSSKKTSDTFRVLDTDSYPPLWISTRNVSEFRCFLQRKLPFANFLTLQTTKI